MYKLLIITSVHDYIKGGVSVVQNIERFETQVQAEIAQKQIERLQDALSNNVFMSVKTVLLY